MPSPVRSPLVSTAQGAEIDSAAIVTDAGALKDQGLALLTSDANAQSNDEASAPALSVDMLNQGALQDPGQPVGPAINRSTLISYSVQSGDNLSRIASYFGISVQTILDANPGVKAASLKIGQVLEILPTSGVIYQARSGDTLESIATAFGVPQDKITQFNQGVNFSTLSVGQSIVIPGGTDVATNPLATQSANSLPNFNRDFAMPATGHNWGTLNNNGVDITNSCGTPVVAAASGVVVPDESTPDITDGWNDGYGNFVLIEHAFGNNVETRYAYLGKVLVQPGDYVTQGQEIGLMGQTGDANGCSVYFEVLGAQNPFGK